MSNDEQQVPPPAAVASATRTIVPVRIKSGDRMAATKSVLSYGRSRSGKTRFAASWPRPLFISDASERGWSTIETMPVAEFFEPDVVPQVWPVEDANQMAEAIRDAKPLIDRGEVMSLVVDSLTFYADSYFGWIKKRVIESNPGKPLDSRALYGNLAEHLKDLRIQLHKWLCNVVWLCLEKGPDADHRDGGPMLTGQTRDKFPAGCDHVFYHRCYTAVDTEGNEGRFWEMHTAPWGVWLAGGRDSGQLPDSIFNPTYREIATLLNLPDPIEALTAAREAVARASTPSRKRVG